MFKVLASAEVVTLVQGFCFLVRVVGFAEPSLVRQGVDGGAAGRQAAVPRGISQWPGAPGLAQEHPAPVSFASAGSSQGGRRELLCAP